MSVAGSDNDQDPDLPPSAPTPGAQESPVVSAATPAQLDEENDPARASAQDDLTDDGGTAPEAADRNWMGYVAYATGALGLSVVAIVLGFLGLGAARDSRANNRSFATAGLILGVVGLVASGVGVWWLLGDRSAGQDVDIQAQQDVSAVGAAIAIAVVEVGDVPDVAQTETGYVVAEQTIAAHLTAERTLTLTGSEPVSWCVEIVYEGGDQQAYSYGATTGMAAGSC